MAGQTMDKFSLFQIVSPLSNACRNQYVQRLFPQVKSRRINATRTSINQVKIGIILQSFAILFSIREEKIERYLIQIFYTINLIF